MKNYLQEGDTLQMTAPYAVASGAGALVGSLFGVALSALANGAVGAFLTDGVVSLVKEGAGSGQAWTENLRIYWDNTNKRATVTSTSNSLIGVAVRQVDGTFPITTATVGAVRLNGISI